MNPGAGLMLLAALIFQENTLIFSEFLRKRGPFQPSKKTNSVLFGLILAICYG